MLGHIELALVAALFIPLVTATCNIDSAGVKTYSTSDGLVITKVAVTATFRVGCGAGSQEPVLHAETDDKRYLAISSSSLQPTFKSVSFIEEPKASKSRWIEIKIFDDDTYQKLVQARQSGSSESYYKPIKTISVSHYGVSGGPFIKMETIAAIALVATFIFAHTIRSKNVN